jgi:hypothetical protein
MVVGRQVGRKEDEEEADATTMQDEILWEGD